MLAALHKLRETQKSADKLPTVEQQHAAANLLRLHELVDTCRGVRAIYGAHDRRRASRPRQYEDYCREQECMKRRARHLPTSRECCDDSNAATSNPTSAKQPSCAADRPCQDRYQTHVLSHGGTWKKGYEQRDVLRRLLIDGEERNGIAVINYAQWQKELAQGHLTHPSGLKGCFD